MRKILFRGKRKDNGEWIYGSLIQHDKCFICSDDEQREVCPETVGEYTGINDMNGTLIFEGDIVRTQEYQDRPYSSRAKKKRHIGVVKYIISTFNDLNPDSDAYRQVYDAQWLVDVKDYGRYGYGGWSTFWKCEVVGNIHDDPELLNKD